MQAATCAQTPHHEASQTKATLEVVCIPQTLLHLFLKPSVAFHVEAVPKEYRGVPVPASHDCGVP